jgi:hypothetical protein
VKTFLCIQQGCAPRNKREIKLKERGDMRAKIIIALVCAAITPLALVQTTKAAKTKTNKANPLETQAPTPVAEFLTVTAFTAGQFAIEVQSTPDTRPVKYLLAKNVRFVDSAGKAVDPSKIHPGTRVRLENKSKGKQGKYRRVVVLPPPV